MGEVWGGGRRHPSPRRSAYVRRTPTVSVRRSRGPRGESTCHPSPRRSAGTRRTRTVSVWRSRGPRGKGTCPPSPGGAQVCGERPPCQWGEAAAREEKAPATHPPEARRCAANAHRVSEEKPRSACSPNAPPMPPQCSPMLHQCSPVLPQCSPNAPGLGSGLLGTSR